MVVDGANRPHGDARAGTPIESSSSVSDLDETSSGPDDFVRRLALVLILGAVAVALGAMLWTMTRMFLLVLLAVVFAVFFHGAARRLHEHRGWGYRVCFGLVVLVFLGVFAGAAAIVGPSLATQFRELNSMLPDTFGQLQERIMQDPYGERFVQALPTMEELSKSGFTQVSGTSQWIGGALDAVSGVALLVALAIFLMIEPSLYRRGALSLVPAAHRERGEALFDELETQLYEWTRARFAAMLFVAVFNSLGLWLAGVPMALALGVISGLCTFVPFVGPIVAAVPGLALALVQGPVVALAALGVYVGAQALEGYVVTPWLQQQMAALPPAMMLLGQFAFGSIAGISGLVVAGPATLVLMSLVRVAFVEGMLGDTRHGMDSSPAEDPSEDDLASAA